MSGRTGVVDEDLSGHEITSRTAASVKRVNAPAQEDRQIIITYVVDKLDHSCGSAYSIVHEDVGYRRICVRWGAKVTYI